MHIKSRQYCYNVLQLVIFELQIVANKLQMFKQEGQHPLTGQRAANFRLLANQ